VERAGAGQREPRKRRARRRRARGTAQSNAGVVGARNMAGEAAAVRQAEKQRRRSGGRRRRIGFQFPESAGTPL
jgi:hypothetical protein